MNAAFRRARMRSLALVLTVAPVWGESADLKCGRFYLVLGDAGRPLSLRRLPDGEEVLSKRSPGAGFYLQGPALVQRSFGCLDAGRNPRCPARLC